MWFNESWSSSETKVKNIPGIEEPDVLEGFKNSLKNDTSSVLNKLRDELPENWNALKNLESQFWNKEWFNVFKWFFLSEKITNEQRKLTYDLIESWEFEKYINNPDELNWAMFSDSDLLIDFLDSMIQKWKKNNIEEIKNLKLDISLTELKYYEEKYEWLLKIASTDNKKILKSKLDEIKEKIIEISKDGFNQTKTNEKQKKEEKEKIELLKTKLNKIILDTKKDFINVVSNAIKEWKINDNQNISNLLKDFGLALEKGENTDEIRDEIVKIILSWDNLKQIITQAKADGKYNEVYSFLTALWKSTPNWWALLLQTLENTFPDIEHKSWTKGYYPDSLIRNKEMWNYFGTESGIGRNWDKYIHWDKMIDFSENPPKWYLVNEKWYKLENDIQQMMNKKEIIQKRKELQSIKLDYFDLEKSQNKKRPRIEELSEIQEEDRTENQKIELTKLEGEFKSEQTKIEELRERAKIIMEFFDHTQLFDKTKEEKRKEDEDKKRETLEFIHSIGFDLIPQGISDSIIARINSQRYRWIINWWNHWFEINWNINLANWEFGEWEWWLENKNDKKVIFTKLFNLILTGDPTKPINVEIVKTNINRWSLITPNQINSILYNEESWILNWFWVKYNQLEKNFRGKKKEDKQEQEKK